MQRIAESARRASTRTIRSFQQRSRFSAAPGNAVIQKPTVYNRPMQVLHWTMAGGMIAPIILVKCAQWSPKEAKDRKANLMFYHKSFGLLLLGLLVPRLALRMFSRLPAPLPATKPEHFLSENMHHILYAMMVAMPVTGVTMGYFSGKGIPFFWTTIPGASEEDKRGNVAKRAYNVHTQLGFLLEYMIPVHVGASFMHALRGHKIFQRMTSLPNKPLK